MDKVCTCIVACGLTAENEGGTPMIDLRVFFSPLQIRESLRLCAASITFALLR